ncbi:MAG: hypothetical protein QM774_00190 [Gordonia sp. (in: high G+C Gram-positive bacteria)]|uniref:hypothetical protein n=1 Tax=Gordonia sp. (in: high G+C Gram-positive bacteria) TaxID=84139 RepID=UPI0039E47A84
MSNSLQPVTPQSLVPTPPLASLRLSRQTAKQLSAITDGTVVRSAAIQAAAEIQQSKVDAVVAVGSHALQQTALISSIQAQLALAAPAASGDLDYIKTLTVVGLGQVVAQTNREVNR